MDYKDGAAMSYDQLIDELWRIQFNGSTPAIRNMAKQWELSIPDGHNCPRSFLKWDDSEVVKFIHNNK